jgi:hypothetical protein
LAFHAAYGARMDRAALCSAMNSPSLHILAAAALATAAAAQTLPAPSAATTEWRMTGVTQGVVDAAFGPGVLEFADGPTGMTSTLDTFTTTQAAGIAPVGGVHTNVLRAGRHINPVGYHLRPLHGQGEAQRFTLVYDLYAEVTFNVSDWTGLWQSRDNLLDAELHLEHSSNGFWHDRDNSGVGLGSVAPGTWAWDTWFRLAYVVDAVANTAKLYVNGSLVMSDVPVDTLPDGAGVDVSWFLSDQNSNSWPLFVAAFAVTDVALTDAQVAQLGGPNAAGIFDGNIGSVYCGPGNPNSTGMPSRLVLAGSPRLVDNDVTLRAVDLPSNAFGFFLTSRSAGMVMNPGGSQGILCVSGAIGRYVGPGQIKNSGALGTFELAIDLGAMPTPTGPVAAQLGDTWRFQAWHRDSVNGVPTSNFTDGVALVVQ